MSNTEYQPLILKKNEERRIKAGHPWVFSNEIDPKKSPLSGFEAGQPITLFDHNMQAVGNGYINPHSLICARLMSRAADTAIDGGLITHRLNIARSLRDAYYDEPFYRAAFSESDGLPGLVLDRFGDIMVAQINTAGMELLRDQIAASVSKVFKPKALLWRNDSGIRLMEGLERYVEPAFGQIPEAVPMKEAGLDLFARPVDGQKTGWFYDQRANRDRIFGHPIQGRVLDLFSYLGAWGLRASAAGASEVLCVDSSPAAVAGIEENIRANNMGDQVRAIKGDVFEVMSELRDSRERFDLVIVDPPAFAKKRKDIKPALKAYQRVNQMAMQLLGRDGRLVSCSCSYHIDSAALTRSLSAGARHLDRQLQLLQPLAQGIDHPIHPALPESGYLKGWLTRVLPTG